MKPFGQSIISKIGFWQGLVIGAVTIATTIATFFIVAGGAMQRLTAVESLADEIKKVANTDRGNVEVRLQKIEDKLIDKEDFKELRQDVKDLMKQRR